MPHAIPKAAPQKKRRKSERTKVPAVECKLWILGKKHSVVHGVIMRDIGAGGTLVSAAVEVAVGAEVLCNFKLPAGGKHSLRGRVLRCAPRVNHDGFDVAVAFDAEQSSEKELMNWVLAWIALQQRVLMGVPTPQP